jgi:hypothetical protein
VCHHDPVLGRRFRVAGTAAALMAATGVSLLHPAAGRADELTVKVGTKAFGGPMPGGFLGVSFEYRALRFYAGGAPRRLDPVPLALLQGLAAGGRPVIRVGGNSTDETWWRGPHQRRPIGVDYRLTRAWMATARSFAERLRARLILGINLDSGRPGVAATEGRALVHGIGRRLIQEFEIGNEPDLYGAAPGSPAPRDAAVHRYDLSEYEHDFAAYSRVLPPLRLAGPALSGPSWVDGLGTFAGQAPRLGLLTYHRYPLTACIRNPSDPGFPSITNLLSDSSSEGLADGVLPVAQVAREHHLNLRLTELNSASCEGRAGVSDSFASALWGLDTLFNLKAAGVHGVNFHMLPGSHYELFTVSRTRHGRHRHWQAFVHPLYYGALMFARAFPPGAAALPVQAPETAVKAYATRDPKGVIRVTLINKDPAHGQAVDIELPGRRRAGALQRLRAPSAGARSGVRLAGQSFGAETATGQLAGRLRTTKIAESGGSYRIELPAASAALLTVPRG